MKKLFKFGYKITICFVMMLILQTGMITAVYGAAKKPETPVLSGKASGNEVTLTWNKVKRASGYHIFLYYKAYGKYKCVGRIKDKNITSFKLTGSTDKIYTYKIRSYLKSGSETLYNPF